MESELVFKQLVKEDKKRKEKQKRWRMREDTKGKETKRQTITRIPTSKVFVLSALSAE